MQTYLERYLEGEHVDVWAELVSLGPDIRKEPLYSDAQAVAKEIMTRAGHNVSLLIERLKTLKYRFVDPDRAWTPPGAGSLSALAALEQKFGPFPLSIRTWCEVVGVVNLIGAHPQLSRCHGYDWGGSDRLECYGDPMAVLTMVQPYRHLVSYYLNRLEDDEEEAEMEARMPPPFSLEVGLSGINKAGESGGGGIVMLVPNAAFDAPLLDPDGYWTGTWLVPYLRTCFKWGGFPGLRGGWFPGQQWDPKSAMSEIEFLTRDLLPL